MMTRRLSALSSLLAVAVSAGAAAADTFETAPNLRARDVLPPALRKGKVGTVDDEVGVRGYLFRLRVQSPYGRLDVLGTPMLRVRQGELEAMARLDEVSRSEVFVRAAGRSVVTVGRSLGAVLTDPEGTLQGLGGGLKRAALNLGRRARRTGEAAVAAAQKERPGDAGGEEGQEEAGVAGKTATGAAYGLLGVTSGGRRWARVLGVDPYTDNVLLRKALDDVGKIDAAGAIAGKIVLPIPVVAGKVASVGDLVWAKDPEELLKINEQRLAEIGVERKAASTFLRNRVYSPSRQTRLVAALHAARVPGAADYLESAGTAEGGTGALFFVNSAEMLAELASSTSVTACLPDSGAMVARTADGRAVVMLPLDYVLWTAELEQVFREIAARARAELGADRVEMRLSGRASPRARRELTGLGWTVTEGLPLPALP